MRMLKVLALGLLVALTLVPMAGAQGGTWVSSFNVINLSNDEATVEITFYDEAGEDYTPACLGWSGTPAHCDLTNPFTLAGGAKKEINLPTLAAADLPDGRYSVVISADQPVAAISSLLGDDGGKFYAASYTGMEDLAQTKMYLPGVMWSFYAWYSHFSIQNLTGATQNVDIYIYDEGLNTVCWSELDHAIPPYSSYHLDLEAKNLAACDKIPDWDSDGVAYNGSAKIEGEAPIAVIDNQTTKPTECSGCHLEQAYNGVASGTAEVYLPDLYRGFASGYIQPPGWNSSINIQNVGAASVAVTVTLFSSPAVVVTKNLPANAGWLIYLPVDVPTLPTKMWETYGAKIESDGEIVALANAATPFARSQAMTYSGIASGGAKVAVPVLWHEYYGWNTSLVIQNLGNDDLIPHICYSPNANPYGTPWGGACYDLPAAYKIPQGASRMIYQGDGEMYLCLGTGGTWNPTSHTCTGGQTIPTTYLGGATVTIASGSGPIAAVANATHDKNQATPGKGDWSMSYNGINP